MAPTALPPTVPKPDVAAGDYVVVIGRLLPGDPETPSPDNYSVKAQKVLGSSSRQCGNLSSVDMETPSITNMTCISRSRKFLCR